MRKIKIADMAQIALFSALIAVFSQLAVPSPFGVPITLQTFIIALTGFALGSAKGVASVFVYIFIGAVGIPVFTGFQGGFTALFGMTGGFIFGFIPFVFLCGIRKKRIMLKFLLSFIGLIICHICGILWFSIYSGDLLNALLTISVPYISKDLISVAIAMPLAEKIRVISQKYN